MKKLSEAETERICGLKHLVPALVRGTGRVQFIRDGHAKGLMDPIPWGEFWRILGEKSLAVYEDGGYIIIRRA